MSAKFMFEALSLALAFTLFTIFVVVVTPVIKSAERIFYPVVTDFQITAEKNVEGGKYIWVFFNKKRDCDFLGVNWFSDKNRRFPVVFIEDGEANPLSRPTGPQFTGPWFIPTKRDLAGTKAKTLHKFHILWNTETDIFP